MSSLWVGDDRNSFESGHLVEQCAVPPIRVERNDGQRLVELQRVRDRLILLCQPY